MQTEEAFSIAVDGEVALRKQKSINPNQLNLRFKLKENMSSQELEKSRYDTDTINLAELKQQGVAENMVEAIAQLSQEMHLKKGRLPVLQRIDSIYRARLAAKATEHCILLLNRDRQVVDCLGDSLLRHSTDILPVVHKKLGLTGLYSIELVVLQPNNRFWSDNIYFVLATLILVFFVIGCLMVQLTTIRLKEEWLKQQQSHINGVVHDLKSPLAGTTTLLSWLSRDESNPDKKDLLIEAGKQCRRMSNEVENILSRAKLGERYILLHKTKVDLPALAQEAIHSASFCFYQKPHKVKLTNRLAQPIASLDERYIYSVIYNLVENALKYSDEGVQVELILEETPRNKIRIVVTDTGWGIAPRYRRKLFHSFYQVPREGKRKRKGYGVGLSFVYHIVRAHRGTSHVTGRKEEGSTFIITLPRS
jgi:signal transduction histidine kinase